MEKRTAKQRRALVLKHFAPYLKMVGEIASLWSQVEWQLDFIVWELLNTEQQYSACITAQLGFNQKLRALKALVAVRDRTNLHEALIKTLNKFTGDAMSVYDLRNRAVHDAWMMGVESKRVSQNTAAMKENRLKFGESNTTIKDLDRTTAAIRALLRRVRKIGWAILGALAPSPYKYVLGHFTRTPPRGLRPDRRSNSPGRRATRREASSA